MEIPKWPRTITDEVVEKKVPKGGKFNILRDQHSFTQGPGGVDIVSRRSGGKLNMVFVPRTDSLPQVEGPEEVVWRRR